MPTSKLQSEKNAIVLAEEKVLDFWRAKKIFQKSLEARKNAERYVFYDGPPFATGTPHYGHILASAIKDAVPRYQTMRGKYVERRWGWDTHGLPIENIVERKLAISGRKEIEKIGIGKFNTAARAQVLEYAREWKKTIERMARWVDFDGSYKTMDNSYIESVWWAFSQLYDKGLIYESTRVLPYCPRCETPVAQSEIAMDNSYKKISDLSVYVALELSDRPGTYLVVWTTTPWTLPGNTAVAIGSDIDYVLVEQGHKQYFVAVFAKEKLFPNSSVIEQKRGRDLVGLSYKPPFDYYLEREFPNKKNAWKIYAASFISNQTGSGLVHIAPAFGEEDMELARTKNLPSIWHVTGQGKFALEVKDFAGFDVKPKNNHQRTDVEIIKYLFAKEILFKKEIVIHPYPHCYRCETPLYYYAIPAWFVKIQAAKPRLEELNEKIHWVPTHLKHGRFLKSMREAPDWNISRNRYWASPLPIWKCPNSHLTIVRSIAHLRELSGLELSDLHRPHIDAVTFACPTCQTETKRVPEVFDCWFESASMPFAAVHYPFENKDWFKANFPADFVVEYIAQTRTWFYYMHVLSTLLFDEAPFRHVVTTGNVLAQDGQKMSKSKQNFPNPWQIFDTYGADALRYYLLASPLMKAEDLNFSETGVLEIYKRNFLRLKNVLSFYSLYPAEIEGQAPNAQSANILDIWILERLQESVSLITNAMEHYELDSAFRPVETLVDDLSVWYLRRSRERLKDDSPGARLTLREALLKMSLLLAPFVPFIAEEIFLQLRSPKDSESVHLADWPVSRSVDQKILDQMATIRQAVSLGLEKRSALNLRVRQPLSSAKIMGLPFKLNEHYAELMRAELNVQNLEWHTGEKLTVELNPLLTDELRVEGLTRDLIHAIQILRKNAQLKPNEQVLIAIHGVGDQFLDMKQKQTQIEQATHVRIEWRASSSQYSTTVDKLTIMLER
ncbi:isoleucine--tRNA ligase [Candidatus Berkelbacteria bacterium]|nr:isoleucine--tRNA ligase [Candidatus Berkelbacteria bacterium]